MLLSICAFPLYLNRLCYTCYPLYAPVPFIFLYLNRLCYTCYPLYAPVPFIFSPLYLLSLHYMRLSPLSLPTFVRERRAVRRDPR